MNKLSWYPNKKEKVLTGQLKKTLIDNPAIVGSNEPIIGGWKIKEPEIINVMEGRPFTIRIF